MARRARALERPGLGSQASEARSIAGRARACLDRSIYERSAPDVGVARQWGDGAPAGLASSRFVVGAIWKVQSAAGSLGLSAELEDTPGVWRMEGRSDER